MIKLSLWDIINARGAPERLVRESLMQTSNLDKTVSEIAVPGPTNRGFSAAMIKAIGYLTEENEHTEAILVGLSLLKHRTSDQETLIELGRLTSAAEAISFEHIQSGSLTESIAECRNKVYHQMMGVAEKVLDEETFRRFKGAY